MAARAAGFFTQGKMQPHRGGAQRAAQAERDLWFQDMALVLACAILQRQHDHPVPQLAQDLAADLDLMRGLIRAQRFQHAIGRGTNPAGTASPSARQSLHQIPQ